MQKKPGARVCPILFYANVRRRGHSYEGEGTILACLNQNPWLNQSLMSLILISKSEFMAQSITVEFILTSQSESMAQPISNEFTSDQPIRIHGSINQSPMSLLLTSQSESIAQVITEELTSYQPIRIHGSINHDIFRVPSSLG